MAELDRVIRQVEGVAGVLRRGEGEERRAVGLIRMWGMVGLEAVIGWVVWIAAAGLVEVLGLL